MADTIVNHLNNRKIIIDKSTVPVGIAEKVELLVPKILKKCNVDIGFSVVSNPESLKEGTAVYDCQQLDRIIIGTGSSEVADLMTEFYAPFNPYHGLMIMMDIKSPELTNRMVRHGTGLDARIGYQFISLGCGYGGSCFPKDVQALVRTADSTG